MSALPATPAPDDLVWRALADPTRRSILDELRGGPRKTGQLAGGFDMTRFGVMKHLEVLVDAGLVLVERRGRERWNFLNPAPIQAVHRRWIEPFSAAAADGLLRLKHLAESPQGDPPMPVATIDFGFVDVAVEVAVEAPPARVWEALVSETGSWWPKSFYCGETPRAFTIEPRVGGRMWEDWGDGEGLLWATVTGVEREKLLQVSGELTPEFGGPARVITTIRLSADGDGTKVRLTDCVFGKANDSLGASLESGWKELLDGCLKPYAETGAQPERPVTLA